MMANLLTSCCFNCTFLLSEPTHIKNLFAINTRDENFVKVKYFLYQFLIFSFHKTEMKDFNQTVFLIRKVIYSISSVSLFREILTNYCNDSFLNFPFFCDAFFINVHKKGFGKEDGKFLMNRKACIQTNRKSQLIYLIAKMVCVFEKCK